MENNKNNVKNKSTMDKIVDTIMKNKKIFVLVLIILVVLMVFKVAIKSVEEKENEKTKADISTIIKNKETKIIYVGSSNSKKCKKCNDVVNYLKKENIEFVSYDVEDYSNKEYEKMLRTIEINPNDFGYPAVIYIRNGKLYSNVININDLKSVETFIKDYDLKTELKNIK